ncbi:glycoside hydrolase family 2 TIM barrel-domain containing protein [Sphingomonas sp. BIUV-7]|uniref:Glycoside hydrolase family 2 TIM barrel-domain containing protein n=1 Tax=Sphingomonas natans TaxID=3063330 RepID=A0ABT8YA54_9SPHN|nr:glycoside hydrolase family 2 TIM barrel-domain containing protein [Sphingomonas sp. BIUV-7]MDO6415205.1 glycoside hydrolase family 2 TIM barrel-domain containing protein [Sphingomonas sp. BIUV-7]
MRTKLAYALIGIAAWPVLPASAQEGAPPPPPPPLATVATSPHLVSADMRGGMELSGPWHYSIDPFRSGLAGFHGGLPDAGQRRWLDIDPRAEMAKDGRVLYEFDLGHSPFTTLPSSWLTEAPELRHYQGLMWYQRTFPAPAGRTGRFFLRFGAANYKTIVYLNGEAVGRHEGGFTPFAFEVTKLLKDGENRITVGVDSKVDETTVPPTVTDWENYGGVTRPVRLIATPDTYVDDAWVRMTRDGKLAADVHLDGPNAANRVIHLKIAELKLDRSATTDAQGNWHGVIAPPRGLVRWSPDRPKLYDVAIASGEDEWKDRIGFKTIEVRGTDILLNGKPIFLRGISLHEEEIGTDPTRAITPASARALLSEVKTGLHGNYVRLAHYPHTEVMTRMADELGLLVWSEVPVYWQVAWSNPETLATARNMLAENIVRDHNRASVAIWSVSNETPVTDARNTFLRTLVGDVRRLDDTRLVGAALLVERAKGDGPPVMEMVDPLADALDIVAINTYNGWYSQDRLATLPSSIWKVPTNKPLLFSEFGADAKAGFHDISDPQKFSEEFQAEYYRQTLAMMDRLPTLRGLSPWILKDFRSPRRQNPDFQQGWNRKGLISETGQRKQAFDVLAAYYAKREAAAK